MTRRLTAAAVPSRGFTLIEMVTSLVILAVLLVACGSATLMATRAAGTGATRAQAQLQAADAAGRMVEDLNLATNFTQRTSNAVTFTVPDRLSAGSPQTVRYSWSGTPGDPLLRQFNGSTASPILAGVSALNFGFTTRTVGPAPAPTELTIFSHDTPVGSTADFGVTDKKLVSQRFLPTLPSGTSTYTLTHLRWLLKAGPQDAVMNVSIRLPDVLSRPTTTVLAQTTVYGSALGNSYEWLDIPFTGCSGLSPSQALCVVITPVTTGNLCAAQTDTSLLAILSTAAWSTTSNASASFTTSDWGSGSTLTCSRMYVYGTVP